MTKLISSLALIAFIAATIISGCSSDAEKVETAKSEVDKAVQDLDQAKENYKKEYDKFKYDSDERTEANNKSIEKLKIHAKKLNKAAKIEYEKAIDDLEKRNNAMKEKVKDYKEEGNEKWQTFKNEFNHDMDNLGQALKDFNKSSVN